MSLIRKRVASPVIIPNASQNSYNDEAFAALFGAPNSLNAYPSAISESFRGLALDGHVDLLIHKITRLCKANSLNEQLIKLILDAVVPQLNSWQFRDLSYGLHHNKTISNPVVNMNVISGPNISGLNAYVMPSVPYDDAYNIAGISTVLKSYVPSLFRTLSDTVWNAMQAQWGSYSVTRPKVVSALLLTIAEPLVKVDSSDSGEILNPFSGPIDVRTMVNEVYRLMVTQLAQFGHLASVTDVKMGDYANASGEALTTFIGNHASLLHTMIAYYSDRAVKTGSLFTEITSEYYAYDIVEQAAGPKSLSACFTRPTDDTKQSVWMVMPIFANMLA